MAKVKLVSIDRFLIFRKGFLIDCEISHLKKKKDTEVATVRKICLIKLFLSIL